MECASQHRLALPAEEFGVFRRAPRQFQHTHADHERQAAAAARRAELDQQRAAARQRVRRTAALSILLDEDSDVFLGDADFQDEPRPACSSQQRSTGGQQPGRSHTENVRRREEAWRSCDQFDTAVSVACAAELARYAEEDVELAVSAVQRRVDALGSTPPHPCLGGPVERLGHRPVLLCTLFGSGVLLVPQYRCSSCGIMELSPAAVGCQRSSPHMPSIWYDRWLCSYAQQFTTSGGVAMATFCSCADAVAEEAQHLSAEPRLPHSLSDKQLSAAVRHRTYVQRTYTDPARHGADIYGGPLGHCPPCAGAMLAQGAAEVPQAVTADDPLAVAPPPAAGNSGPMSQQQGAG